MKVQLFLVAVLRKPRHKKLYWNKFFTINSVDGHPCGLHINSKKSLKSGKLDLNKEKSDFCDFFKKRWFLSTLLIHWVFTTISFVTKKKNQTWTFVPLVCTLSLYHPFVFFLISPVSFYLKFTGLKMHNWWEMDLLVKHFDIRYSCVGLVVSWWFCSIATEI